MTWITTEFIPAILSCIFGGGIAMLLVWYVKLWNEK